MLPQLHFMLRCSIIGGEPDRGPVFVFGKADISPAGEAQTEQMFGIGADPRRIAMAPLGKDFVAVAQAPVSEVAQFGRDAFV